MSVDQRPREELGFLRCWGYYLWHLDDSKILIKLKEMIYIFSPNLEIFSNVRSNIESFSIKDIEISNGLAILQRNTHLFIFNNQVSGEVVFRACNDICMWSSNRQNITGMYKERR